MKREITGVKSRKLVGKRKLVKQKERVLALVILDASSIHDMDSSGLHALEEMLQFLKNKNITFNVSGAIGPVRDLLYKSGVMQKIGIENQFLEVHDAVLFHESKNNLATKGWSEDALQTNIIDSDDG